MGEDMTATIWEANSPDTLKGLQFDCYVTNLANLVFSSSILKIAMQ